MGKYISHKNYGKIQYRQHITNLTQKNCLFCNREQPNLFIQQSYLNIMYVLHHKRFGCSTVYDKDYIRRDEISGVWAKMEKIGFSAELTLMQPYSRVKGIEFIKLNGENSGALFSMTYFLVRSQEYVVYRCIE